MTTKGTCGACFREVTLNKKGQVIRHGWSEAGGVRQPGSYGNVYHTGPCFGTGWAPYEVSPECTLAFVHKVLFPMCVRAERTIEHYNTHPDFVHEERVWAANFSSCQDRRDRVWDGYIPYSVKIRPGDESFNMKICKEDWRGTTIPSYAEVLKARLDAAYLHLTNVRNDGLFCCDKVLNWEPGEVKEAPKKVVVVHWLMEGRTHMTKCRKRLHNVFGGRTGIQVTDDWSKVTCTKCQSK